jgi:hypothetical protein
VVLKTTLAGLACASVAFSTTVVLKTTLAPAAAQRTLAFDARR